MLFDRSFVGAATVLGAAGGRKVPFDVDLAHHEGDVGEIDQAQGQVEPGLCACQWLHSDVVLGRRVHLSVLGYCKR